MIVVVDFGMGNLGSVANMLKKIGVAAVVSSDPGVVATASKLILPGVGAFDNAIKNLSERGLLPVLNDKVLSQGTPILGLCLGMQLFMECSQEGIERGFGWIPGETVRFRFGNDCSDLKVPHMGWNTIRPTGSSEMLSDMPDHTRFYFVHSYHVVCRNREDVVAVSQYGYEFASIIRKANVVGTQFHPEKSHKFGMQLLRNFAERF